MDLIQVWFLSKVPSYVRHMWGTFLSRVLELPIASKCSETPVWLCQEQRKQLPRSEHDLQHGSGWSCGLFKALPRNCGTARTQIQVSWLLTSGLCVPHFSLSSYSCFTEVEMTKEVEAKLPRANYGLCNIARNIPGMGKHTDKPEKSLGFSPILHLYLWTFPEFKTSWKFPDETLWI